jgi:ComF family protein
MAGVSMTTVSSEPSRASVAASWARRLAGALGRRTLDALLPPRCLDCGLIVDQPGLLCLACWRKVELLASPWCGRCGDPLPHDMGPGAICASCAARPPEFDRARAVMRYGEASRRLVLRFKHADRTDATPAFGRWMARAGAELLADADLIAPVPLHRWRLLLRRYNQAALLAHALGHETGRTVVPDLLVRRRWTPSQGRKNRAQRFDNVSGAFRLRASRRELVRGRRVLLVDDVLTTGATVEACARALKRAGASAVDVLTLARVVRSDHELEGTA